MSSITVFLLSVLLVTVAAQETEPSTPSSSAAPTSSEAPPTTLHIVHLNIPTSSAKPPGVADNETSKTEGKQEMTSQGTPASSSVAEAKTMPSELKTVITDDLMTTESQIITISQASTNTEVRMMSKPDGSGIDGAIMVKSEISTTDPQTTMVKTADSTTIDPKVMNKSEDSASDANVMNKADDSTKDPKMMNKAADDAKVMTKADDSANDTKIVTTTSVGNTNSAAPEGMDKTMIWTMASHDITTVASKEEAMTKTNQADKKPMEAASGIDSSTAVSKQDKLGDSPAAVTPVSPVPSSMNPSEVKTESVAASTTINTVEASTMKKDSMAPTEDRVVMLLKDMASTTGPSISSSSTTGGDAAAMEAKKTMTSEVPKAMTSSENSSTSTETVVQSSSAASSVTNNSS